MTAVLLDTHAWAWSLTGDARLPNKATALLAQADSVLVSPISLFEIGQKVRIGKWPEWNHSSTICRACWWSRVIE
ncbi:type II toxin-antitoxin system VapC family toxin [Sinorhizobium arboris]|uniref:type II toxin-antitoxin system VapC family toxin n=1 Tax=Sinorhizobium arboris TaxID=76745 RepID=UPI0003F71611|nr:hypothetical protein [Sinorhizobium arboris]